MHKFGYQNFSITELMECKYPNILNEKVNALKGDLRESCFYDELTIRQYNKLLLKTGVSPLCIRYLQS